MKLSKRTTTKIKRAIETAIFKQTETIVTSYKDLRIQKQMSREKLESYLKRYETDRRKKHGYGFDTKPPKAILQEVQREFILD